MTKPALAPESPDLVWFRGPDTIRFLNDIISQEIASIEPGSVVRSLLLGAQGKLDHILWVLRGEEEVGLATDSGRGETLTETLGRYRIRVDVDIEPSSTDVWVVVGEWQGFERGRWSREDGRVTADVSWDGVPRTLVTGYEPDLPQVDESDYEAMRIAAGEPRWGVDVTEKTIPHESGLVPATVDFTKGCFLGQELVARIDSRGGNVPRRVRILDIGDATAEVGAAVLAQGEEVGAITSRGGRWGMAVLKRGVEPGDEVRVGETTARIIDIPAKKQFESR